MALCSSEAILIIKQIFAIVFYSPEPFSKGISELAILIISSKAKFAINSLHTSSMNQVSMNARECLEETGLEIRVGALLDIFFLQEHPRGASIFIVYRAGILSGTPQAQDDVGFFHPDALPHLAFSSTL